MTLALDSLVLKLEGTLIADQRDTFYFDHPLDHLPATLLLDGAVDLAQASLSGHVAEMRVKFHRFGEIDEPVDVRLTQTSDASEWCALRFSARDEDLANGHVVLRDMPPARATPPARGPRPNPVDRALVHRHREDNVAIGGVVAGQDESAAEILDLAADHPLRHRDPAHRSPVELIEAARQLTTCIGHAVWEIPDDWKYVFSAVGYEQRRLVAGDEPLRLRTSRMSLHRRRIDVVVELEAADGVVGSVAIEGLVAAPRIYRHLRWSQH